MIFASNNLNKVREIKKIFKDIEILSLNDLNLDIEILENGQTFYDNALIKAKTVYERTNLPTVADDSGLCIEALNDWPGISTKRISHSQENDEYDRNMLLIEKTKSLKNKNIKAVCTLVYYDGINIVDATGYLYGTITDKVYDGYGFGFDKIFMLKNDKTVSMLTSDEKNKISARSQAAKLLREKLILKNLL